MKKNHLFSIFVFLSVICVTPVLQAAESTMSAPALFEKGEVCLEKLLQLAREKNPQILSVKARWMAAQKRVPQASSLEDPTTGMDLMGGMVETRTGPQKQRFVVSQQIPFPLKLWEKHKQAQEEAKAAEEQYRAVERDIVNEIQKIYYDLYEVDHQLEVTEEIHSLLKKFEGVAEARYANATGEQRDVAKAQAEVSLILQQIFNLKQRRESLVALMNSLLDRDPLLEIGSAIQPNKPELKESLVDLINLAVMHRQEIKEMQAMEKANQHGKNLAKLAYIPDVNVGFEYTVVGSGSTTDPMDGKDSWMFPLRINVPLWQNRLIPAVQEAGKKLQEARANLARVRNETFYQVKDAYVRFDTGSKVTLLYETAVIPQAKLALTADQASYEAGKTDFLNLLDSERVYLNAKLTYIEIYSETLKSYADLERATGFSIASEVSHEK